jgi:exopolysaccharide biosynthesis polyprenyl glycosylphosphotransferase
VLVVDATMLVLASVAASASGVRAPLPIAYLAFFCATSLALFARSRSYRHRLEIKIMDEIVSCFAVSAAAAMLMTLLVSLRTNDEFLASSAIQLWCLAAILLSLGRSGVLLAQLRGRQRGRSMERTLIVGAGEVGALVASRLSQHPEFGLKPVGYLDKDPSGTVRDGQTAFPVLGASWDLERIVHDHEVERVVVAFSNAPHRIMLDVVARCERLELAVTVVPRLFERIPSRVDVVHVGGLPLLNLRPVNPHGVQYTIKYALDPLFAAIALLLLSPILITIAVMVRLRLGRPILYRQLRVGRDGQTFEILKFRTMRPPTARDDTSLEFSPDNAPGGVEGDDRRAPLGVFLRRWSLDELPQLLNVLRGEMSFVGPRSERLEFVEYFDENVYRYGERHRVKGGLTGWAQIHRLRGKTSLADRVEWDNYYIENFSLWLDFKIILLTIPEVFRGAAE